MEYVIEKVVEVNHEMMPIESVRYKIKHFRPAIDSDGKAVTVVDEDRIQFISIEELEKQKTLHQNAIAEIDEKITKCKEVEK